jgi:hypothetical protein
MRVNSLAHTDDLRELLGHAGIEQLGAQLFRATANESSCSCGGTCDKCAGHAVFFEGMTEYPPEDENGLLINHCAAAAALARWSANHLSEPSDDYVHQGAATVVCNGAGDYRVAMNSFAGAPCGIEGCVRQHEESHIGELRARFPDGCKNPDGTPKPDGTPHPTGGPGYDAWLRQSECNAYTTEIACQEANLATASAACKPQIEEHLKGDRAMKSRYCGGGC